MGGLIGRRQRFGVALAVATLVAGALLAGCSDDGDSPNEAPTDAATEGESGGMTIDAPSLVKDAVDRMKAGDNKAAKPLLEQALVIEPENLYALYNLGLIAQQSGDTAQALDYYDRALEAKGDYVPALINKAILLETSDLEQSVRLYRQVLKADEKQAAAHMRLGFALLHLGDKDEAERHLTRGLELDPSMADIKAPDYG